MVRNSCLMVVLKYSALKSPSARYTERAEILKSSKFSVDSSRFPSIVIFRRKAVNMRINSRNTILIV